MSQKRTFVKVVIPIVVIIVGIIIMKTLITRRAEPRKEVKRDLGVLVELLKVKKENTEIVVRGTGTVEAAQEVTVTPQVSGRVTYISPRMVVGGFFQKDEILFEIEDTDYRLALERAMAARAKAEYELATIESRAHIARTEWERINKNKQTPPNPLVLFKPQLKNAKAALSSASATVEQARLDLERTKVKATFNSRVRSENIDLGQYVKTGTTVAVLAGTDTAEIGVPLPLDDLRWLNIPRLGEKSKGQPAFARLSIGGKLYEWQGHVVRSTGEVDPRSRMMQLVVGIKDPYGLKEKKDPGGPALAVGTFVDVRIKSKLLKNVFIIPRIALRDNSTVWIMDTEEKLQIRKIVSLRMEKNRVIVGEGLVDGDMIVLTNLSGAANGMKLRPVK